MWVSDSSYSLLVSPSRQFEDLHSQHSTVTAQLDQLQTEHTTLHQKHTSTLTQLKAQLGQERARCSSLEREITQTSVAACKYGTPD